MRWTKCWLYQCGCGVCSHLVPPTQASCVTIGSQGQGSAFTILHGDINTTGGEVENILTSKGLLLKPRNWWIGTEIFTETWRAKLSRLTLYHRCLSVDVEVTAPRQPCLCKSRRPGSGRKTVRMPGPGWILGEGTASES